MDVMQQNPVTGRGRSRIRIVDHLAKKHLIEQAVGSGQKFPINVALYHYIIEVTGRAQFAKRKINNEGADSRRSPPIRSSEHFSKASYTRNSRFGASISPEHVSKGWTNYSLSCNSANGFWWRCKLILCDFLIS